eukprot:gene29120-56645_t
MGRLELNLAQDIPIAGSATAARGHAGEFRPWAGTRAERRSG